MRAYADWWITVRNPDKEIITAACMKSLLDSSRQIPSKFLESRTCKVDSSVLLRGTLETMLRRILMIYLMIQELLLSFQWVVIKLISPHTRSMRKLFSIVVMLIVTRFLSNITMHKVFMYQMTTLKTQVNVSSNAERLDLTLCTMMRLTLIS